MDQPNLQTDAERRCLDDGRRIVRSTTKLFGEPVVLVPMYPRSKRPRFRRFQTFTLDLMQDECFVACIGRRNCNVAVLLGTASRGLCTFDFDDDQNALTFLEQNPAFEQTLMTTGRRGRNLWFSVDGDFPPSFDVKGGGGDNLVEFRADGRLTVVHGTHPCGYTYRLLHRALPIRVSWPDIRWPSDWKRQVLPLSRTTRTTPPKPRLAAPKAGAAHGKLDASKLLNVVVRSDGSYNAQCPACAEQGHDTKSNHLIVFENGAFGCIAFFGDSVEARGHRRRVIELAGSSPRS